MRLGIEVLLDDEELKKKLQGRRVALLAHPASVNRQLNHSIDLLFAAGLPLSSAFGPQHGLRGDKQDNMVETENEFDAVHQIPVFSLYGSSRTLTDEMLDSFDVLLVDLQDIGGRIYTYVTTLLYALQGCEKAGKTLWVLDRPNPAGRPVEGLRLEPGQESFVGAGPLPMRHGLTMGELSQWFTQHFNLSLDLEVVKMRDYSLNTGPGWGWPESELPWVNPSPNIPTLNSARCFSGTVLLEGTQLSEGRGTTRALEVMGAPKLNIRQVLARMQELAPQWCDGAVLRECFFEPTFHKYHGELCHGLQIHTDTISYNHQQFRPYRLVALFLRVVRELDPEREIWRDFHYEYEKGRLAIDVINGGPGLREWVDGSGSVNELEQRLVAEESAWADEREEFLFYRD